MADENTTKVNTNENLSINENGNVNMFGLDISISDIIGEKIVDKWFSQITPEDMNLIFKAVEDEIFSHGYNDEKFFKTTRSVKSSGWGCSSTEETPIWRTTKARFATKYNEIILSKVDEILSSKEYQDRAMQIAKDIVDYATEGYKKDLQQRVYERLVTNTSDTSAYYINGKTLQECIRDTVAEMLPRNDNYRY